MEEETATTLKTRFTWTIKNFSSLQDIKKKHYSDVFVDSSGYKWRMLMYPKGTDAGKHFSLYLAVADSANLPDGWTRYAEFSLAVLNQTAQKYSVTKETEHHFKQNEKDWGFDSFMPLALLHGPGTGFLVNDTIICEAEVVGSMIPKKEIVCVELKNQGTETDTTILPDSLELTNQGTGTDTTILPNCADEEEPCLSPELRILKNQVFDEMPQNPHYAPLNKYSDMVRKGMMIGLDIAFVKLSKEIQKLDDPQKFWSKVNGFTKQLMELEEMGYNVNKLREQVHTLKRFVERDQAAKRAMEQLEVEVKDHESKITELKGDIDILKEESDDALKGFASTTKRMRK